GEPLDISEILRRGAAAQPSRVAFVASPGATWPLPLYELALMGRRRALELGLQDLECVIVTPEQAPLVMFGRIASEAVAQLLDARRIRVITSARVSGIGDGVITLAPGDERLEVGEVVALPS